MTLDEKIKDDAAYQVPGDLPEIVVQITEAELRRAGNRLDESRWTPVVCAASISVSTRHAPR